MPVVAFDLDDTLFLERDYVRSGFRAVGEWLERRTGLKDLELSAWELFLNGQRGDIFDRALPRLGLDPTRELVLEMVGVYRRHRPEIALLPDAEDCLTALHQRGVPTAVITDGLADSQRAKVEALGLCRLVDAVIYTSELGPGHAKPDPLAFQMLSRQYPRAACCYVADNPSKDFIAPLSLGWRAVRVRRTQGLHAGVDSDPVAGPHYELDNLQELPRLIEGWQSDLPRGGRQPKVASQ